ncbi:uncharacterized protein ARMOST_19038 [Armillaria ostoyae]|uniref:Uncharacterized protein n=1 Tax=Armillaria ostoyae TaxID=47428 RepID=A0A284S3I6_ARMOS|nr:uncharacterized protein ARMOST_19038 [Armillaria ostoyae]
MLDSNISLQATGLLALADLPPVTVRTALSGTASYSDALVLAPGMHLQQSASEINHGEFPITGAMTTGYIFRVENPATVYYLQSIGVTGHLATTHVYPRENIVSEQLRSVFASATLLYALCPALTLIVAVSLVLIRDWWGLGVLGVLGGFATSRLTNVVVIKRRDENGWKGQKKHGVKGDLFILRSLGQWLRDLIAIESFAITCATMLVYVSAVLAFNASPVGSLLIGFLLLYTAALLTLCNSLSGCLHMCNRSIRTEGAPKKYERRLVLANELIAEMGRNDWAIGIGLVLPKSGEAGVANV